MYRVQVTRVHNMNNGSGRKRVFGPLESIHPSGVRLGCHETAANHRIPSHARCTAADARHVDPVRLSWPPLQGGHSVAAKLDLVLFGGWVRKRNFWKRFLVHGFYPVN